MKCNALRWRMQSFAWTDAMLCVRVELNGHRKVCPILDKIKGGKTHPTGHLAPRKFLLNPYIRNVLNIHCLCAFARVFSRRCLLCDIFLAKPQRSQKFIFPCESSHFFAWFFYLFVPLLCKRWANFVPASIHLFIVWQEEHVAVPVYYGWLRPVDTRPLSGSALPVQQSAESPCCPGRR